MPLYEVHCEACGYHDEEIRSMAEGPRTECPKCGAKLQQVYKPPTLNIGGYSPMHPRKLRGKRGQRS